MTKQVSQEKDLNNVDEDEETSIRSSWLKALREQPENAGAQAYANVIGEQLKSNGDHAQGDSAKYYVADGDASNIDAADQDSWLVNPQSPASYVSIFVGILSAPEDIE